MYPKAMNQEPVGFYREAVTGLSPGFQPWVSCTKCGRPERAKGSLPQSNGQQHLKSTRSSLNLTPLQGEPEGRCEPRVETLG
jgi:hypothetical protein